MPEFPHKYWAGSEDKEGYSGVAMLCKTKPLNVTFGIGEYMTPFYLLLYHFWSCTSLSQSSLPSPHFPPCPTAGKEEHDKEGRVITAEFPTFYLVTAYVPNAGRGLVRLDYRKTWDVDFRAYLSGLDEKKPLVLCGDLNVAHQEIDLKNPKGNRKNAGFTTEEREGFTQLLSAGFVDSFRELYPEQANAYTFWTYMMNSRSKNVGWRLDYFVLSSKLVSALCDSKIRNSAMGSDHCPITLHLAV